MVAVIHAGSSLRSALNYNERKVKEGVADFLDAGFYLQSPQQLSFHGKFSRLASRGALNTRVKVNTLHISLNFAPDEKLSHQQLKAIAGNYLAKIGFDKQPYLLYEHHDSGHQHVHLITTTIKADGRAIRLHNLGKNQSEKARKELEVEFGLVRAQNQKAERYQLKAVDTAVAQYGKSQTKRAIANVLRGVLDQYKYCSVAELNAVLGQYNVTVDGGKEGSRIFENQGLVYRLLDGRGHKIGVPIKASDFYFKPTLKQLSSRFIVNGAERVKHKARVKNLIDLALLKQPHSLQSLREALQKQGVYIVVRASEQGGVYGLTYVDQKTKCVFNGSVLGKAYSAKGLLQRCVDPAESAAVARQKQSEKYRETGQVRSKKTEFSALPGASGPVFTAGRDHLLSDLFAVETNGEQIPWQLKKTRKRKRRKIN